jgi:MtN3 and saliva related transmembrane protein
MTWITFLGVFAGLCTSIAFFPQALKTAKSKSTKDISIGMYVIFIIGLLSWTTYGILTKDIPVIMANAITFPLACWILILKIKYG